MAERPPFEPDRAQAALLRASAAKDGLRFDAYLPPALAAWVLDEIIAGRLADPSEAVFLAIQDMRDLTCHPAAREALLKAVLTDAMDQANEGKTLSSEEVRANLERHKAERQEPPRWQRGDDV